MTRKRSLLAALWIAAVLSPLIHVKAQTDPVDALLARMSLEERVGQLFVVRFWGKTANTGVEHLLNTIRPGGVVLLDANVADAPQLTQLTNQLQSLTTDDNADGAGVPLLLMLDQESPEVQRLRGGFTPLVNPLLLGAVTQQSVLLDYGRMVGGELAAVGVNMNLSPVVDLATTPGNPIVEGRSMGDDPQRVAAAARLLIQGMTQAGVISVAKHFPGHGDVVDTHVNSGTLPYDLSQLENRELVPFLNTQPPVMMFGHISAPALDPSGLPATLSAPMVNYVRAHGYQGIIMTDALDMGAIVNHYRADDASLMAIKAGVDLVLLGANPSNDQQISVFRAVLHAVQSGEIPESQINGAVKRVLQLKMLYNLLKWSPLSVEQTASRIASADGAKILAETYLAGLTEVRNVNNLMPLKKGTSVGLIFPSAFPEIATVCGEAGKQAGISVKPLVYEMTPLPWNFGYAVALSRQVDVSVVFTDNATNNFAQQRLVQALPQGHTIVVALRSPYDFRAFPTIAGYLLAYDEALPAYSAACQVIFGLHAASGSLPVKITN